MIGLHKRIRRLVIEQLSERIAFHAGELEHDELDHDASLEDHSELAQGHAEHQSELRYTPDGFAYYYDPPVDPELAREEIARLQAELEQSASKINGGLSTDQFQVLDSPSNLDVPSYHSNPSYSKKIYLDFDGHVVTGTTWNNQRYISPTGYNTGSVINAPAFSLDGDLTSFNAAELSLIQQVWARVSEDYAPFQVDVTTEAPPASLFTAGGQAMRVVVSTNFDATTGQQWYPAAGGVAYINSWNWTNGSPCWIFTNHLEGVPKYYADAASHEVGHTLGLGHDGRVTPAEEYYRGHGSGPTYWGPIMGPGYYANLTQWSKGEYTSATNTQDDLAIISGKLPYIVDDHGNTSATATQLNVGTASTLATSGLITTRTDVDAFRFPTQAGSITLNVAPFDFSTNKANLDAKLTLVDSAGATVAMVDNVDTINSTLTISVAKGFYSLLVDGSGRPAIPGDEGYSDYASIGIYSVSGTIVPNAAPVVVNDALSVEVLSSVLIDVLANDSDANSDLLNILSIGSPAAGAAVIEAGKIRYTAAGASGQVILPYTIVDELGLSANGSVTVTITGVNTPPTISDIANSSTAEDTATSAIDFTVSDGETAAADLIVSGSSSNPALVPNGNIIFGGSGSNRTVSIVPLANQVGTTTIIVTVTDAQAGTTTDTFVLTVTPVNDAPTDIGISSATVAENASGVAIGNLLATDPDAGDAHIFSVDDARFEVVGSTLRLKSGISLNYETANTINVNVTASDVAISQFTKSLAIAVIDLPEMVGGAPVLGDGTAQRSLVREITVTLEGAVTIASGAFLVSQRGQSQGSGGQSVTTTATPMINGSGQTVVTLTFSGALTRGLGALVDGYYQLIIDGSKISRSGQTLDINGDGIGGDFYSVGNRETDGFFALYGDTSGDGIVGVSEFGQFRATFGKSVGQIGYDDRFEYEGDASIGVSDFGQFRSRFGKPKLAF